jgi:hypothetical protein
MKEIIEMIYYVLSCMVLGSKILKDIIEEKKKNQYVNLDEKFTNNISLIN